MKDNVKPIVGISIGDANGIGPEIILRSFSDTRLLDLCTPIIYGSFQVLEYYKKTLNLPDIALMQIEDISNFKKIK
jgi:4-hydroxy-L-threonine phosphate dehydrogenase PdxA